MIINLIVCRRTLIENKKHIPTLDVTTRWNSTYLMLVKLFELQEFITTQTTVDIDIDWDWVELYIEAFKGTYEATLTLQQEHLAYSDFFILWMELKLKCEKSQNYITKKLLSQLQIRECKLLQRYIWTHVVFGRLPLNSDIKQFYHDVKFKLPQMSELAQVMLATPATQVSVERSFSALNFILNEKRTSVSPENINSILIVKLNS